MYHGLPLVLDKKGATTKLQVMAWLCERMPTMAFRSSCVDHPWEEYVAIWCVVGRIAARTERLAVHVCLWYSAWFELLHRKPMRAWSLRLNKHSGYLLSWSRWLGFEPLVKPGSPKTMRRTSMDIQNSHTQGFVETTAPLMIPRWEHIQSQFHIPDFSFVLTTEDVSVEPWKWIILPACFFNVSVVQGNMLWREVGFLQLVHPQWSRAKAQTWGE